MTATKTKDTGVRWSPQEDEVLTRMVLSSIQEGKTQTAAFRQFSQKSGRTVDAISYRFNKIIRPVILAELKEAQKQAQRSQQVPTEAIEAPLPEPAKQVELAPQGSFYYFISQLIESHARLEQKNRELSQELAKYKEKSASRIEVQVTK